MRFHLIAIGKMKAGPLKDLYEIYRHRLQIPFTFQELEVKGKGSPQEIQDKEQTLILDALDNKKPFILLDERGRDFSSEELTNVLEKFSKDTINFVVGGADGVTPLLRSKASLILSFGRVTWPHMLARILLMEQLYRVQQIQKNHPYHRRL